LTHFFKGVPRLPAFLRGRQTKGAGVVPSEQQRRLQIVDELRRKHPIKISNAMESAHDVFALPPDSWLNAQLSQSGENWRVQNVDGFRYEIYDAV
jgi:hypothetical protein